MKSKQKVGENACADLGSFNSFVFRIPNLSQTLLLLKFVTTQQLFENEEVDRAASLSNKPRSNNVHLTNAITDAVAEQSLLNIHALTRQENAGEWLFYE